MDLHFTPAEMNTIRTLLDSLQSNLTPKGRNLSADERRELGSINEQNKLLVLKVWDYRNQQPALSSPQVNWPEFEADLQDRNFLEEVLTRLRSLAEISSDAKILHDRDVYLASLSDYNYTKYMAGTQTPGYDVKLEDIKQFFPGTGPRQKDEPENNSTT